MESRPDAVCSLLSGKGFAMNIALMTEHFKKVYSDPIQSATKNDPKYDRLMKEFHVAEHELQSTLDEYDKRLFLKHEQVIGHYFDVELQLLLDVYLMGAQDRERMLE